MVQILRKIKEITVFMIFAARGGQGVFNKIFPRLKNDKSNIIIDKEGTLHSTKRENSSSVPSKTATCQRNN
jgi:hypothetical protein